LEIRPDQVDQKVEDASKFELEQAREKEERRKPGSGKNLTFEKILAERGQTMDEFREMIAREILVRNYWYILINGIQAKRHRVTLESPPEELRRLYTKHRAEFDQKWGVRIAIYSASPESFLEEGKRTYDESVAAARAHLDAILADLKAGKDPE